MKKPNILSDFSLRTTDFSSLEGHSSQAIVNEWFGMTLNVNPFRENFVRTGQPYHFEEGRILMVSEGEADCELNLEEFHIEKGDIILLVPETVMELKKCSDDFNMVGVIYKENIAALKNIILHATASEWKEVLRMMSVLWDIAHHAPFRRETVQKLVAAIINNIQDINKEEEEQHPTKKLTRQETLFHQFKKIVNEHCATQRAIPFYADKLYVSPHHLSAVISKVSGKSVMFWINRAVVLQAKVLLKNDNLMVYEIAERLNFPNQSAFGKFFKRETGMSPGEYRDG